MMNPRPGAETSAGRTAPTAPKPETHMLRIALPGDCLQRCDRYAYFFDAFLKTKEQGSKRIQAIPARIIYDHGAPRYPTELAIKALPVLDMRNETYRNHIVKRAIRERELKKIAGRKTKPSVILVLS